MNTYINYLVEANLGLLFFYGLYVFLLKGENQFSLKRFYLLATITFSLSFPLLHLNTNAAETYIPTVRQIVPSYWLPEVVVVGIGSAVLHSPEPAAPTWSFIEIAYWAVCAALTVLFIVRLSQLVLLIVKSQKYGWQGYYVAESTEDKPTFSFFHFIFIGQANRLSGEEKLEVLKHEAIHVQKLHSLDVMLINILGIIFWFNPVVALFRKSLTQLHEYEADAQTVADRDADLYCGLLAKVALQSSEFSLANHFNNSLTVKRIAMIKSIKTKISGWKLVPVISAIALFFFAVACQDQVAGDLKKIAQNSSMTADMPKEVRDKINQLKAEHPNDEYVVLENTPEGKATLDRIWKNARANGIDTTMLVSFNFYGPGGDLRSYTFLKKGSSLDKISEFTASENRVYTVVEEAPAFPGGFDSLAAHIQRNLHYPQNARNEGIQGKVFIAFVVTKEGKVTDANVVKGVAPEIDNEALRVVSGFPVWKPGRQSGEAVAVKFVIPITFSLAAGKTRSMGAAEPEAQNEKMDMAIAHNKVNNKMEFEGNVWGRDGKPLVGAHIVLKNSTTGATTGTDGHFKLETDASSGVLVVSYIGFDSYEYAF